MVTDNAAGARAESAVVSGNVAGGGSNGRTF